MRVHDSDAEFSAALGPVMQQAILAEVRSDLRKVVGDSERRALRAKAARRVSQWSPKRRRVQSCVVLRADGTACDSVEEGAAALAVHWGGFFGGCSGSEPAAAARLLQDNIAFPSDLWLPTLAEFQDMASGTPTSALGPDGLTYGYWVTSDGCVRFYTVLYDCMQALSAGECPPAGFNGGIVIFIPKRALRLGETVYAALPEQFRPLTLANCSQKVIREGHQLRARAGGCADGALRPARIFARQFDRPEHIRPRDGDGNVSAIS